MFETLTIWITENVADSREFALIGFGAAIAGVLYVAWSLFSVIFSIVRAAANTAKVRVAARSKSPGFRILIASRGDRGAMSFAHRALSEHLEKFTFRAPFQIMSAGPLIGDEVSVERAARSRLKRSGADMIIWADSLPGKKGGLRVFGISRGGGVPPQSAERFKLFFVGKRDKWKDTLAITIAYKLAKKLQPALSQPEGFRPERVKEIAAELDGLLNSKHAFSEAMREELETDFCAGALHVYEAGGDAEYIETVLERRSAKLEGSDLRGSAYTQARLDLGRALLAKADINFDPVTVREGMAHLDAVINALGADSAIRRARLASDAVTRGKNMLETRKRFSLNFGS